MRFNALIPELVVAEMGRSLAFYRDLLGFSEVFARPEEGFRFLEREGAQIMLVERTYGVWFAHGPEVPFGNGCNFALQVSSLGAEWEERLRPHWFAEPFEHEYQVAEGCVRVRQLVVGDPDGYLVRLVLQMVSEAG
jgi:catechol 2,3-dioxygenase-like lactoylglutathione lyase family enzyme